MSNVLVLRVCAVRRRRDRRSFFPGSLMCAILVPWRVWVVYLCNSPRPNTLMLFVWRTFLTSLLPSSFFLPAVGLTNLLDVPSCDISFCVVVRTPRCDARCALWSFFPAQVEPMEVLLRLESSSKWPDELEAVRSTGTAFLIRLAQCLEKVLL